MPDSPHLWTRITMLTLAVQALYITYPDLPAALRQLERFTEGIRDVLRGTGTPDEEIEHLTTLLGEVHRRAACTPLAPR